MVSIKKTRTLNWYEMAVRNKISKTIPAHFRMTQPVYVIRHGISDCFENRFLIPHFQDSVVDFKRFGSSCMFELFFELADVLGAQ